MSLESENKKENLDIKPNENIEKGLNDLLVIKEEINSYREGKITQTSMSGIALKFLDFEQELDEKISELNKKEKLEKLQNLKNEATELENKLNRSISEYESLNKEYDRLDGTGISLKNLGDKVSDAREEMEKYDKELALLTLEIEKIEKEIEKNNF